MSESCWLFWSCEGLGVSQCIQRSYIPSATPFPCPAATTPPNTPVAMETDLGGQEGDAQLQRTRVKKTNKIQVK